MISPTEGGGMLSTSITSTRVMRGGSESGAGAGAASPDGGSAPEAPPLVDRPRSTSSFTFSVGSIGEDVLFIFRESPSDTP
eukprot:6198550-Pleurochrysis_carterae.AAC.1